MSDEIETIDKTPKSWAAWKREAERLQAIIDDMALAAMDGEPVVFTDERNLHHIAMGRETSLIWGKQNSETGDIPLYRHAKLVPDALIQAVALYEQVKRENPPVETGAYKEAVEWVLREACRAVIKDE